MSFDQLIVIIAGVAIGLVVLALIRRNLRYALDMAIAWITELRDQVIGLLKRVAAMLWTAAKSTLNHIRPGKDTDEERPAVAHVLIFAWIAAAACVVAAIADYNFTQNRFEALMSGNASFSANEFGAIGALVFVAGFCVYVAILADLFGLIGVSVLSCQVTPAVKKQWVRLTIGGCAILLLAAVLLTLVVNAAANGTPSDILMNLFWTTFMLGALGALISGSAALYYAVGSLWAVALTILTGVVFGVVSVVYAVWFVVWLVLQLIKLLFVTILGSVAAWLTGGRLGGGDDTPGASEVAGNRADQLVRLVQASTVDGDVFDSMSPVTTTMRVPRFQLTFESNDPHARLSAYQARVSRTGDGLLWDSGVSTVDHASAPGDTLDIPYGGEDLPKGTVLTVEIRAMEAPSGLWSAYSEPIEFVLYTAPDIAILPNNETVGAISFDLFYAQAEDQPATGYHLTFRNVQGGEEPHYDDGPHELAPLFAGRLTTQANPQDSSFSADRDMGKGRVRLGTGGSAEIVEVTSVGGTGPFIHYTAAAMTTPHPAGTAVCRTISTPHMPLASVLGDQEGVVCVATVTSTPTSVKSAPFSSTTSCPVAAPVVTAPSEQLNLPAGAAEVKVAKVASDTNGAVNGNGALKGFNLTKSD